MTFHRLTTPSYFGGLPAGYDLINSGGAAADDAKVGGPNAGTYWHAFGEDATSSNFNRPAKAFSENFDHLDDLFHRDIVVMHKTADVLAGAPVASIVLPAGTYLGGSGYTNNAVSRARLFSVRDNSDRPILDTSLAEVVVTSVTLSGGDAIGGGFSTNSVTLNLAPSIPTSTTYRVYYGVRQNLSILDTDTVPSGRDFALIYGHTTSTVAAHQASAIAYAGGAAWADGTTNPAATAEAQLDKIITDLAERVTGGGAIRVGYVPPDSGWFTGDSVGLGLDQIDSAFRGITPIVNLRVGGTLYVNNMGFTAGTVSFSRRMAGPLTADGTNFKIQRESVPEFFIDAHQISAASVGYVAWDLMVPHGATVTSVDVHVKPATGHGSLPATMPKVQVFLRSLSTATDDVPVFGTIATDASGSVVAYEAAHIINVPSGSLPAGMNPVQNDDMLIQVQVYGETGANSVAELVVLGVVVNFDLTFLPIVN